MFHKREEFLDALNHYQLSEEGFVPSRWQCVQVWEQHKHQMRYIPVLSCQPPASLNNGDGLSGTWIYFSFLADTLQVSSWVCLEAGYRALWNIDLLTRVSTFLHRPPWVHVWGLHAEWAATRPLCISRDLLRAFYWFRHYRGSPTPDAVKSIFHFSFVSSLYLSFSFFFSLVSVCLSRLDAQMRDKLTRQRGTVFMSCFWLTRDCDCQLETCRLIAYKINRLLLSSC